MQIKGETSVNKLIVLFVFDKMETSLSERTIIDICSSTNDWINYMDCVMLIPKLVENGFICKVETEDDPIYTITTDGRESLANFYISIPTSIREEIALFIKNNRGRYLTKQECKSDYFQNKDGTFTVYLKILAPVQPMLELKVVIPDKKSAHKINKQWQDKAADIYALIYENLVD